MDEAFRLKPPLVTIGKLNAFVCVQFLRHFLQRTKVFSLVILSNIYESSGDATRAAKVFRCRNVIMHGLNVLLRAFAGEANRGRDSAQGTVTVSDELFANEQI